MFQWFGCKSADSAGGRPIQRSCVCLSRPARRPHQVVVVDWRWPVLVGQAAGTGALRLATSCHRFSGADAGAAVDAVGRYRLAAARTHLEAGVGLVNAVGLA